MDHLLVPRGDAASPEVGRDLVDELRRRGILVGDEPGPASADWQGRFAAIRVEDPGRTTLFANQVGGFRVTCPRTGEPLAGPFGSALTAWRAGGPFALACPRCGDVHPLDGLRFAPPAAFGRFAIRTVDVDDDELGTVARALVDARLGPTASVLSRVGWR